MYSGDNTMSCTNHRKPMSVYPPIVLSYRDSISRKYSLRTVKVYASYAYRFLTWVERQGLKMDALLPDSFTRYAHYLAGEDLSTSSVSFALQTAGSFCRWNTKITGAPMPEPSEMKRVTSVQQYARDLSPKEVKDILAVVKDRFPRYYALVWIMAYGALRVGEVISLKLDNVRVKEINGQQAAFLEFVSEKSDRVRKVPMPTNSSVLFDHIAKYQGDIAACDGHLFCVQATGGKALPKSLGSSVVPDMLLYVERRLGLEHFSAHSFRRTCITRWHREGMDLMTIKAIAGHVSLNTTAKYIEFDDETLHNAIMKGAAR